MVDRADARKTELSPRLLQIMQCLAAGCSEKEIALSLKLSVHTVHEYVKQIHRRFDVHSRGELLAWWYSAPTTLRTTRGNYA